MLPHPLHTARSVLAATVATLALLLAAPSVAAADDGSTAWGVRTGTGDLGSDRENFSYTIDPGGARLDDVLTVANHGDVPLDLDVYAADGYTTEAGQIDVLTREDTSEEIGAWLTPGTGSVHLEPGASADIPFSVTVPAHATPGDHVGAIVTSRTQAEQSADVETRLGVRVFVRVTGELTPSLTITDAHVDYDGTPNPFGTGDATVTYTVHNDGNVRLGAGQQVHLAGPFGWFGHDAQAADVPELLPGESWQVSVPVAGVVPAFRVAAHVVLSAELPDVAGLTPGLAPIEATATGAAVPWALIALIVLIGAATWFGLRRRRTRVRREQERVEAAVAAALRERDDAEVPA
ncbi:hypothetical protein Xcel_2771 [Xylanimonas cellulosilytica DSM 15894]|uniref:DUF916 domain-containing protein n=1 Tax=Xylanimonas cellulosilytica (strain DSM 15894 / JCM 12276 / CECT 5975 / KCTC 9989 / LMG 20990 / NBRC 107835 / XIL07) TaxID=446471 RepID=D1BXZ4_XYLCX|nr:hypothetical protein [Xylanimonas cellulosilytica]ACZ31785.1 hypothetical protein Xcel_2771 [Xylanimonas cellulosilytica DSM 15894]